MRSRRFDVAVASVLVTLGVGAGFWVARDHGSVRLQESSAGGQGAKEAWTVLPGDPNAAGDGRDQQLTAVAASGATIVATGSDSDPQQSGTAGRAVFLVSADGGRTWKAAPVQGGGSGAPRWVSGSAGGWLAGDDGGTLWTSVDGLNWTRRPDGAGSAFRSGDRILGVAGTAKGWVAIGIAPAGGPLKATPVLWVSPDGAKWERRLPAGFGMPVSDDTVALTKLSLEGTAIRIDGVRMKHLEDSSPFRRDIAWQSDDGGKSWKVASKSNNRKVARPDSAYSLLEATPKATPPSAYRQAGQQATASATAGSVTVFAGRTTGGPDLDPVLAVRDGSGHDTQVDLTQVPGALTHDLTITAFGSAAQAAKPLQVAVGSRDGHPSLWTSTDGTAWTRASLTEAPERGRFTTVAYGPSGWAAAGTNLLYTSPDGTRWTKASSPTSNPPQLAGGPAGYLLTDGTRTWFSKDLASWDESGPGSAGAVSALTAHARGFTLLTSASGRHVSWNSPDGRQWTAAELPSATGTVIDRLAAKDRVLLASGRAGDQPVLLRSTDGGATWTQTSLPGPATVTVLTATGDGFFAAGIGSEDVVAWTSKDGQKWTPSHPRGDGLSGPGLQQPIAAALPAGRLTVLTSSDDPDGLTPFLWRPNAP